MNEITVKINVKDNSVNIPEYATEGAAGVDLAAAAGGTIPPGGRMLVPTGLFIEIPKGWEGQIRPRSGLAIKHGITMLNSPGTIDSDYRGEICVIMFNSSAEPFSFAEGDRVAQMVFAKVTKAKFEITETLSATERGEGGFGSTGKNEKNNNI